MTLKFSILIYSSTTADASIPYSSNDTTLQIIEEGTNPALPSSHKQQLYYIFFVYSKKLSKLKLP